VKTEEEWAAEMAAAHEANKKLVRDMNALKAKMDGIDPVEYAKLKEGHDAAIKESGLNAKKAKDLEVALQAKEAALSKHLIDSSLTSALAAAGVSKELLGGAKALLGGAAKVAALDDGSYSVTLGGKPLADALGEWTKADGKSYIQPPANSGGGAGLGGAGSGGAGGKATMTRQQFDALPIAAQAAAAANTIII
jgi:hypothetical protein